MGRNVKPGITFYRIDSGHILNKKVRLLCNEFDSDGYYIWNCLIDYAYLNYGYYFDYNDKEELELFASDYCKKKVHLIKEVIAGCIRRDLFDKIVADSFGILTSEMMQDTFIYATAERRKKGSVFQMMEPWILVNKAQIPGNIEIVPGKKNEIPGKNPQTETRQDKTETRQDKSLPDEPAPLKKVSTRKNEEPPEPFWDLLVKTWFDFGIEKFHVTPSFQGQDPKIFKRIIHRLKKRAAEKKVDWNQDTGPARLKIFLEMAYSDKWISENFLLSNLEKQFDKVIQNQASKKTKVITDLQYLFQRFCEGDLDPNIIVPKNFLELKEKGLVDINTGIVTIRMNALVGSVYFSDSELLKSYQAGIIPPKDEEVLMRIAVIEYFKKQKQKLYATAKS